MPARDAGAPVERDSGPPLPRFEGLPIDCWLPRNSFCNPANNDGCRDDEACDLTVDPDGQPLIMCFPPPATEALGDTCDNQRGPFCAGGLRCMERRCMDTCCADAECTVAGERCVPLDPRYGALGVCRVDDAPDCGRPGDPCRQASDCCSRDCHIDHCH
ncbi:MAG: hypothetical protein ACFCGT_03130 [Sandaracinaceae bacterium]